MQMDNENSDMAINETPKGLIYGLEDRPPLRDTIFAALQHLLAIFAKCHFCNNILI